MFLLPWPLFIAYCVQFVLQNARESMSLVVLTYVLICCRTCWPLLSQLFSRLVTACMLYVYVNGCIGIVFIQLYIYVEAIIGNIYIYKYVEAICTGILPLEYILVG